MKSKVSQSTSNFKLEFLDSYLKFQIFFTSLSFVSIWVFQYFTNAPINLIEKLSFRVIDPPWLPSNIAPIAILGKHYFGDWQLDTTWAIDANNPYISSVMPSRTPPLGLFFTSFLGLPGLRVGWILFVLLSIALVLKFFYLCCKNLPVIYRFCIFVFAFVFNAAVIVSFDRGSSHILAFTCVGLSVYYFNKDKFLYGTMFYLIATAFKPQFIVMLLFLIGLYKVSKILLLFLTPVFLNLLLMFAFYHPLRESLLGYLEGSSLLTTGGGNENAAGIIADSISIVGFISRLIESKNGIGSSIPWIENNGLLFGFIGVIWLAVLIITLIYRSMPWSIRVVLILSSTSLILPSSGIYTLGWTFVALFLIIYAQNSGQELVSKSATKSENILLTVIFVSTITPTFFTDFLITGLSRRLPLSILYLPALIVLLILTWVRGTKSELGLVKFR